MPLLERTVRLLRVLAVAALAAMMLVTIVDVTLRNTVSQLVLGGVELVQLALVAVVFFALPETFLRNEQITIDVLDRVLGARRVQWLRAAAAVLTLLLIGLMAWRMSLAALDTLAIGDLTSDLGMAFIWYWLPLVAGAVVAVLTQLALVTREVAALRGRAGNGAA